MMMARPGTIYSHGEAITVEVPGPAKREPQPIADSSLRNGPAEDAQVLLLHRIYVELKEVLSC